MLTYLLIGLIVQVLITFDRAFVRKVAPDLSGMDMVGWATFVLTYIIGAMVNIVLWPLSVVIEIVNAKNWV